MHLYNFHLKRFKAHKTTPTSFDLFRSFKLPDDDLKRSKLVGVVLCALKVLSESYIGAFVV